MSSSRRRRFSLSPFLRGEVNIIPSNDGPLLLLPVRGELLEEGGEILDLVFLLDAGERHLGAGDLGLRVLDVLGEHRLVPGDAGILVGVGIAVARDASGVAAEQSVQQRLYEEVANGLEEMLAEQAVVIANASSHPALGPCVTALRTHLAQLRQQLLVQEIDVKESGDVVVRSCRSQNIYL